jgi:hypothetical protein
LVRDWVVAVPAVVDPVALVEVQVVQLVPRPLLLLLRPRQLLLQVGRLLLFCLLLPLLLLKMVDWVAVARAVVALLLAVVKVAEEIVAAVAVRLGAVLRADVTAVDVTAD